MREKIVEIVRSFRPPVTILELGAHDGTDTLWLAGVAGPHATYIVVEPDPRVFSVLEEAVKPLPQVQCYEIAIANHNGEARLYLSDNDSGIVPASSSIKKPKEHLQRWPWCSFDKSISVACLTLDTLAEDLMGERIDLIWADIQGAEKEMVEGGRRTLAMTDWLYCESYDFEAYEGQALRHEFLAMLPDWDLVDQDQENVLLRRRKVMDAEHCIGCEDDFYNGKNPYGVEACWHRENAKREKRLLIPIDLRPPYLHIKAESLPTCYKKKRHMTIKPEALDSRGYWK